MSRQEHHNGMMWSRGNGKLVEIGLTPEFFKTTDTLWHIMPPRSKRVVEKSPLLSIITYDGMWSYRSAHAGRVVDFNQRASIMPDRLSPDEMVIKLDLTIVKHLDEDFLPPASTRDGGRRPGLDDLRIGVGIIPAGLSRAARDRIFQEQLNEGRNQNANVPAPPTFTTTTIAATGEGIGSWSAAAAAQWFNPTTPVVEDFPVGPAPAVLGTPTTPDIENIRQYLNPQHRTLNANVISSAVILALGDLRRNRESIGGANARDRSRYNALMGYHRMFIGGAIP